MRRFVRRSFVSTVVVATALGVVVGTAPAAPKPSGEPVKLMVIFEKSAGIGNPDTADGAIAAAKALTKAGGLGGRPVKVLVCDTANDPNRAAECGREAVSEGVVALVGNLSVHSGEFLPLMAENKIPSIGLNPATAADFTSTAAFPVTGGAVATFGTLPRGLAEQGAKKIALVRPDIAAGAVLKTFANNALKSFDQEIVADVPIPTGAPDMSTYVASATAGDPDAIVVGLPGEDALDFVLAARQVDPDLKFGLISTEIGAVTKALGADANGILQVSAFYARSQAKVAWKKWDAAMKAAGFKKETSGLSYAATLVLAEVAKDLPEITGPAVFDALPGVTDLDIGLLPLLQFGEGGIGGIPRIFNACEIALEIKGKKTVPVTAMTDPFSGEECQQG